MHAVSTTFALISALLCASSSVNAQGNDPVAKYTKYDNTDVTPCIGVCIRVGNCGYSTPNPVCNITFIAVTCDETPTCTTFNSNGWLKSCGNTSCGVSFESSSGTDTYIKDSGIPPPPPPAPAVPAIDDVHYPSSEPSEALGAMSPAVSATDGATWAVLTYPAQTAVNVTVGQSAFNMFVLLAILPSLPPPAAPSTPIIVVERSFNEWGYISYVQFGAGGSEIARLRKGTGAVSSLVMPNYNALVDAYPLYYSQVAGGPADWLGDRILNDTNSQANFSSAIKYMPPQRDYAMIGAIFPYQKYSVSPDGRIKTADDQIYTPDESSTQTGPGTLVFDPALYLPANHWPATNWTYIKSALVGNILRVVSVIGYDVNTTNGFEQIAFAPGSEASAATYLRLRATAGADMPPASSTTYLYYNVSKGVPAVALDSTIYYTALFTEQSFWNATFSTAVSYNLPTQEGARQRDMSLGGIVLSASIFVGYMPNYGTGGDYWSPQPDRGGTLPFQTIALDQALLDSGLWSWTGDRIGWYFDNYIVMPEGNLTTEDWEDSCPDEFADGLADYGEMQDIFFRTARAMLAYDVANGTQWLAAHIDQGAALAMSGYKSRMLYKNQSAGTVTQGLIFGSPEHDTCHSPDYYYHNNAWYIRGMMESGKFLRDVCPTYCPEYAAFGSVLVAEAESFMADFQASLALSVTFNNVTNDPFFIPPIATVGMQPFQSMIESTLSEYANFRYYPELLGADVLSAPMSIALQEFRENTFGTVSGITRWSDHLDDMPSSYYLAAALRDDRMERFLLLQYGHMANYMGRGTFTATEQLPIQGDANGFARDYLWSYLEGGIDECIPSIMLPAIATRWQLVYERYDTETLWINKGAPRRWFDPATGGFGVDNALTRFGWVNVNAANQVATGGNGETSKTTVQLVTPPVAVPGVSITPQFAVRILSSNAAFSLVSSSVSLTSNGGGNVIVSSVDTTASIVYVNMTSAGGGPSTTTSFTISASFQ